VTGEPDEDEAGRRRMRRRVSFLATVGVALLVVYWPGCRSYPPVSSPESLQLMRRLYSACNTRNSQWLAETETRLAGLVAGGKVTPGERQAFEKIIAQAKAGDWAAAEAAAFKFAQDQVGVGHPAKAHSDHRH